MDGLYQVEVGRWVVGEFVVVVVELVGGDLISLVGFTTRRKRGEEGKKRGEEENIH